MIRWLNFICSSVLALMISNNCLAQSYTYSIQQFELEDGLLHRSVNTVFEDHRGIIWLGSPNGLQRFDGHSFKSYFNKSPTGIKYNITKIGEDNEGWLWLWNTNQNDFIFIHSITEEIKTRKARFGEDFPITNLKEQTNSGWHYMGKQLPTDTDNHLCFVTSNPNTLYLYDGETGFSSFSLPKTTGFISLKDIYNKDSMWVMENGNPSVLKLFGKDQQVIGTTPLPPMPNMGGVSSSQNNLYFTLSNKDIEIQYCTNHSFRLKELYRKQITTPKKSHFGTLVWQYDSAAWKVYNARQTSLLFEIPTKNLKKSILPQRSSMFEDSKGRMWMHGDYGLTIIVPRKNLFKNYLQSPEGSKSTNSIRGIVAIDNQIYANIEYRGIVQFDLNTPSNLSLIRFGDNTGRPLIWHNDAFYSGFETELIKYSSTLDVLNRFKINDDYSYQGTWAIYEADGQILVGKDAGLFTFNAQNNQFDRKRFTYSNGQPASLGKVLCLSDGPDGQTIYAGTSTGLYQLDIHNELVIKRFHHSQKEDQFLPVSLVYCIYKDAHEVIWLGTNAGLIQWNPDHSHRIFSEETGLSNNTIYGVLEDQFGRIWMSSDYGLMSLDKKTFEVHSYLKKDGVAQNEFNRTSYVKSKSGQLYFGGLNGITALDPRDFTVQKKAPYNKVTLTSVLVYDNKVDTLQTRTLETIEKSELTLSPGFGYVHIHFTLPNFEDDYLNKYAWKIDGLMEDWQIQSRNDILLNKLPYGTYSLNIKGQNSGGTWTPESFGIQLVVLKPFFLQWWFILTCVFTGLVSLLLVSRWRTNMFQRDAEKLQLEIANATREIELDKSLIKKQADDLKELDKTKSSFYANIAHELRTPITLILGPLDSLLRKNKGSISAEQSDLLKLSLNNTKKLEKRVNEILNLSKLQDGKLTLALSSVHIAELIEKHIVGFRTMAKSKNIGITFTSSLPKNACCEVDADKLVQIIDNLMSNAVKHSPNFGVIQCDLSKVGSSLMLSISDEGKGIPVEQVDKVFDRFYQTAEGQSIGGTGIGLTLSKQYAQLMGGDITINRLQTRGACFEFTFKHIACESDAVVVSKLPTMIHPVYQVQEAVPSTTKPRVLVVEDHDDMRHYIKTILESDYVVFEATDGLEAVELLRKVTIDIITSDVMMPNMNGFEFLQQLRSDPQFKAIPVVMVTARSHSSDVLSALEIGIDDYIVKPFYEIELLSRIHNILRNTAMRKKHAVHHQDTNEKEESLWLGSVKEIVRNHLSETSFSVSILADEINMSERTLNRKLNGLVGMSSGAFIREIRLLKAQEHLLNHDFLSVKEVSIAVGYNRQDYFSKAFYKRFGKLPSSYFE